MLGKQRQTFKLNKQIHYLFIIIKIFFYYKPLIISKEILNLFVWQLQQLVKRDKMLF